MNVKIQAAHIMEQGDTLLPVAPIYTLSQELIDEIVDTVFKTTVARRGSSSSSSSSPMKRCSLVSRAFHSRAQMHLFSRIRLHFSNTRTATLLHIIEKRPCIADYIQDIWLITGYDNSWLEHRDFCTLMDTLAVSRIPLRTFALVTEGERLHAIIDTLEHLTSRIIHPSLVASMTTLQLERVKEVRPLQLLSCFRNLQTLRVDGVFWQDTDPIQYSPPFRPSIRTLKLAGDDRLLSTVSSFLNLTDLRHLIIDKWDPDPTSEPNPVQEVINSTKGSLESVGVVFSDEPDCLYTKHYSTFLNLSNQPELHTLNQAAIISPSKLDGLSDVCLTLQTITTPSRIRPNTSTVTLHLNFVLYCVNLKNPEDLYSADWYAFASEISRISTTARPVDLSLEMWYWYDWESFNNKEYTDMKARCTAVLDKVVDEQLPSFKNNAHISVSKSLSMNMSDPATECRWSCYD